MRSSPIPCVFALALVGSACGPRSLELAPRPVEIPVPATTEAGKPLDPVREAPPPSAPSRTVAFPKIHRASLDNGLELAVVASHTLPIVQLRLVVRAGSATDGDLTGLSRLVALMLKDGGAGRFSSSELLSRVESLGANLDVRVDRDAAVLSLSVPKRYLDEALTLLGTVATQPRFDEGELRKLKAREIERVASRAKSSGAWSASMLLWRELYRLPTRLHPYAAFDALPKELEILSGRDLRAHYRKHYVPKNAELVLAGDLDLETAKLAASRAFGAWKGGTPEAPSFASPMPPEALKIFVADRKGSAQSDIYLGLLGPSLKDDAFPSLAVANQVLGGGVAGRLFLDVREKRSLAYSTRSSLGEVAQGPVPLTLYAGTQTAKTGLAVSALLEHLERLASEPPEASELDMARRYLADVLSLRMETIGAVADMVVALDVLGLPDDHYDAHREALRSVTAEEAHAAASEHARGDHAVLVVAGDAETIAPMLSRFGEVHVVDPENGFARVKTLPANPKAALEVERAPGNSPSRSGPPGSSRTRGAVRFRPRRGSRSADLSRSRPRPSSRFGTMARSGPS